MTEAAEYLTFSTKWWGKTAAAIDEIRVHTMAIESLCKVLHEKAIKQGSVSESERRAMRTAYLLFEDSLRLIQPLHLWFQNSLAIDVECISEEEQKELSRSINQLCGIAGEKAYPAKKLHPVYWHNTTFLRDLPSIMEQCHFFIHEDKRAIMSAVDSICLIIYGIVSADEFERLRSKGFSSKLIS